MQQHWNARAITNFNGPLHMENWNDVYNMAFICSIDTYTRYFQFRFIHNILPTNKFLYSIGLTDTDKCVFCKTNIETVKYLMWDCDFTKQFWSDVKDWVNHDLGIHLIIDYKTICFGLLSEDFDYFKNIIILLAKRYIYRCRVEEKK